MATRHRAALQDPRRAHETRVQVHDVHVTRTRCTYLWLVRDELAAEGQPRSQSLCCASAYDHAESRVCLKTAASPISCGGRGALNVRCFSFMPSTRRCVLRRRELSLMTGCVGAAPVGARMGFASCCCVCFGAVWPAPLSLGQARPASALLDATSGLAEGTKGNLRAVLTKGVGTAWWLTINNFAK